MAMTRMEIALYGTFGVITAATAGIAYHHQSNEVASANIGTEAKLTDSVNAVAGGPKVATVKAENKVK